MEVFLNFLSKWELQTSIRCAVCALPSDGWAGSKITWKCHFNEVTLCHFCQLRINIYTLHRGERIFSEHISSTGRPASHWGSVTDLRIAHKCTTRIGGYFWMTGAGETGASKALWTEISSNFFKSIKPIQSKTISFSFFLKLGWN